MCQYLLEETWEIMINMIIFPPKKNLDIRQIKWLPWFQNCANYKSSFIYLFIWFVFRLNGLPWSTCNAGDSGSIPGKGRSSGEGNGDSPQ